MIWEDEAMNDYQERHRILQERVTRFGSFKTKQDYLEWQGARRELLELERGQARSQNEEYAAEWDHGLKIDAVASPVLISDAFKTYLVVPLHQKEIWRDLDGFPTTPEWAEFETEPLAVLEFKRCTTAKLGSPNEEVLAGLPFWEKGVEFFGSHIIENSKWKEEVQAINSHHAKYDATRWNDVKHYFIAFHDCTFECLASSYVATKTSEDLTELIARLVSLLQWGA
jgi:hypothetical protein